MEELTQWIPALAVKLGKPALLVHLWAQQFAKAEGIEWTMNMRSSDVGHLSELVVSKYGCAPTAPPPAN